MDQDRPKRPTFRSVKAAGSHNSPEELFTRLSGRRKSHGYLRGPQQDVLRAYTQVANASDIALELPTGTGKTTVGLLIAEWKRQSGQRVAYLALTNQLAGQVLTEATHLGLDVADLRGNKEARSYKEVGRFTTSAAIGVSTYSNLFNINPLIDECGLLILDDAHGAEQFVSDHWTIKIRRSKDGPLYAAVLADLRPAIGDGQLYAIKSRSIIGKVELIDVPRAPDCLGTLALTLAASDSDAVRFGWRVLEHRLKACLILASSSEIVIRPLVPPTHTHAAFSEPSQRVFMSATLGGKSDLLRAYGRLDATVIRAQSPQWGRRYVFVPGVHTSRERTVRLTGQVWDKLSPRRAVLLTPSDRVLQRTVAELTAKMQHSPATVGASDIADTLDAFVDADDVLLTLAGRYDGLDLPDDQCRLLVMADSPLAISPLERHLTERWKLGPIFRRRERTRLVQGMGRCTRSATDFAVVVWLGQSLASIASSPSRLAGMPLELQREIKWGVEQSAIAAAHPEDFVEMVSQLLSAPEYREEANNAIEEVNLSGTDTSAPEYEDLGADEVRFSRALWDEDFDLARGTAHRIADRITSPELAGYRAWWWYLASSAAVFNSDSAASVDALRRATSCGVNSGWLRLALRSNDSVPPVSAREPHAEAIWDLIDEWGWAGPNFAREGARCVEQLSDRAHTQFHQGLEGLGRCLGADVTRSTEQGSPDVVWTFAGDIHFAFEAKTEKLPGGDLAKKDLLQAKGHRDWVAKRLSNSPTSVIEVIVVSGASTLHPVADTFSDGLFHLTPHTLAGWAEQTVEALGELRLLFVPYDFAEVVDKFSAELKQRQLDFTTIVGKLKATPLKP